MRRLPVYLLIDCSSSMAGEPIAAVRDGMLTLVVALMQDPHALESAHLSVITFNDKAQQIVPLTELGQFDLPELKASGSTAMGAALSLLAERVGQEVATSTYERKGDWKPIVFLMTDGVPTDEMAAGIAAIKKARIGAIIACAAGPAAKITELKRITDSVLHLDRADSSTIKAFFSWVSASIATSSQKVDLSKKEVGALGELPPPPPEISVVR
jgi:uncharacterized protein YegL